MFYYNPNYNRNIPNYIFIVRKINTILFLLSAKLSSTYLFPTYCHIIVLTLHITNLNFYEICAKYERYITDDKNIYSLIIFLSYVNKLRF